MTFYHFAPFSIYRNVFPSDGSPPESIVPGASVIVYANLFREGTSQVSPSQGPPVCKPSAGVTPKGFEKSPPLVVE